MNRPLPSRNRRHRSGDPGWQSRRAGAVSGAVGLVGGVEDSRSGTETRKAAGVESGGRSKAAWFGSGFDRVGPLR